MTDREIDRYFENQRDNEKCNEPEQGCKHFSPATEATVKEYIDYGFSRTINSFKCWKCGHKSCANYYECNDR